MGVYLCIYLCVLLWVVFKYLLMGVYLCVYLCVFNGCFIYGYIIIKYFLIKCFNNIRLIMFVLIWDYILFVKIKHLI